MAPPSSSSSETLPYGIYLGQDEIRRDVPGFSLSLLQPVLHAEDVPWHTHPKASFIFVLKGAYRSNADGAPPVIDSPALIFNPVGTSHRDSFLKPGHTGRFLAISIADQVAGALQDSLPAASRLCRSPLAVAAARRLAEACQHSAPARLDFELEDLCWDLLSDVIAPRRGNRTNNSPAWLATARERIHDQSAIDTSVADLAAELGLHPVYFSRAFRQSFHCSPGAYRNLCRLQNAVTLLRTTNLPLASIALQTGFFDQSHFTTAFRRHFGHAPNRYRGRLQQQQQQQVRFVQDTPSLSPAK